jgi:hypothetical protein
MRTVGIIVATFALTGCSAEQSNADQLLKAQASSRLGPTSGWKLDPVLSAATIQQMRDRAYLFCQNNKGSAKGCEAQQDWSIFEYANAFRLVRLFRSEQSPRFPFAMAHQRDLTAFQRVRNYCQATYQDQGSDDARGLGPCMAAGTGADFFGVLPIS